LDRVRALAEVGALLRRKLPGGAQRQRNRALLAEVAPLPLRKRAAVAHAVELGQRLLIGRFELFQHRLPLTHSTRRRGPPISDATNRENKKISSPVLPDQGRDASSRGTTLFSHAPRRTAPRDSSL